MTEHPISTFIQSFVKFQNMDLEIQIIDDVLQHIFIYATFLMWKSWKVKMTAYPILIFMQSFITFQSMVQEIQMKRAKRDILTYILTYLLTDQSSHRISISWLKIPKIVEKYLTVESKPWISAYSPKKILALCNHSLHNYIRTNTYILDTR